MKNRRERLNVTQWEIFNAFKQGRSMDDLCREIGIGRDIMEWIVYTGIHASPKEAARGAKYCHVYVR